MNILTPNTATITAKLKFSIKVIKTSLLLSLQVCVFYPQLASASLTFSFNYLNPGQGFDDPALGTNRKAALNSAANLLGSYFTNYNANLTFDVTSYNANDGTLASAGSGSFVNAGTFQQTVVQTKIISNGTSDINGSAADGSIDWNFSHNWGLTDTVTGSEFDFQAVAIHELLHSFGFLSFVGNGGTGLQNKAPGTPDTWATFDNFLTDASGNRLISSTGVYNSAEVVDLTGGSSILFNGENAKAANGGAAIPIYSPTTWQDGSSISHLDESNPLTANMIMSPSVAPGASARTLSGIEKGILKDIGYTNLADPVATPNSVSVPVPTATLWLMAGFFILIATVKRVRQLPR